MESTTVKNEYDSLKKENEELKKENELLKLKIKNVYKIRQKAQSEMISDLVKENEELKKKIFIQEEIIIGEQQEISNLKEELQIVIEANQKWLQRDTKLEEQIEELKCSKDKNKWELKEIKK